MDYFLKFSIIGLVLSGSLGRSINPEDTLEERLQALETKFDRVNILLEGFEQLCSKLTESKPPAGQDNGKDHTKLVTAKPELGDTGIKPITAEADIKMISIESTGFIDDTIYLSLMFLTQAKYSVVWWQSRKNGAFARLQGIVKEDKVSDGLNVTAMTTISDVDSLRTLIVMVITESYNVHISLDIRALNVSGKQYFDDIGYKVQKFYPVVQVPNSILTSKAENMTMDGFSTTIEVSENVVDALNSRMSPVTAFYTGMNTTKNPAEMFDIWYNNYELNSVSFEVKNGSSNKLVIRINKKYARYGGFLTIRIEQNATGYLYDYSYGVIIKVINEGMKDVVPVGTIVLRKQPETVYTNEQYFSFICAAGGIPVPKTRIFKVRRDGTLKEMKSEESDDSDFFSSEVLYFDPGKKAKPEGTYICRASNGDQVVEYNTTVKRHEEIMFDDKKTGLTTNSTKKTTIECKVRGMPTPQIELRMNDIFGHDILQLEDPQYKYKVRTRSNVARATLNISPPDPAIYSVICVARQELPSYGAIDKNKQIIITANQQRNDDRNASVPFFNDTYSMNGFEDITSRP